MNYLSKEVLTVLVQEVYESKGTMEIDPLEIHETIKQKFGQTTFPDDFDKQIDDRIEYLKDYDPSTKYRTVFDENVLSLFTTTKVKEEEESDDLILSEDDDLNEIDALLNISVKPEVKSEKQANTRRRMKVKRSREEDESDDLDKRFARRTSILEHNRYIRQAQQQESEGMRMLRLYCRACRLGNKGLRGLYEIEDPIKREEELIRRLHESGEMWMGDYPTTKEIQLAKLSTEGEKQKNKVKKVDVKRNKVRKYRKSVFSMDPNSDYSDKSDYL